MALDLLTTAEVADLLRVPDSTVRHWRHVGTGPRWAKVGKRVTYNRVDVEAWWTQQALLAHRP